MVSWAAAILMAAGLTYLFPILAWEVVQHPSSFVMLSRSFQYGIEHDLNAYESEQRCINERRAGEPVPDCRKVRANMTYAQCVFIVDDLPLCAQEWRRIRRIGAPK